MKAIEIMLLLQAGMNSFPVVPGYLFIPYDVQSSISCIYCPISLKTVVR